MDQIFQNEPDKSNIQFEGFYSIIQAMVKDREAVQKVKTIDSGIGFFLTTYLNPYREAALNLCAPVFNIMDNPSDQFEKAIAKLEKANEYQKAATLLFFRDGDLKKAIECLEKSQGRLFNVDHVLVLVATALAGAVHQSQPQTVWRVLCQGLVSQMTDPHLKLLFSLMANQGDWNKILESTCLPLTESMAIALRFLDNEDLFAFVSKWTHQLASQGSLEGLLLTGWTKQGLDLLEAYIDATSDLQTATLLACLKPHKTDGRCEQWVDSYVTLLEKWQLFHLRAKFDISRKKLLSTKSLVVSPQIYVRCNFCNHSISPAIKTKKSAIPTHGMTKPSVI